MPTSSQSPDRRYSAHVLELSRRAPWWWSLADNPVCTPWCSMNHDPNEFRIEGALTCRKIWPSGLVAIEASQVADEDVWFSSRQDLMQVVIEPELSDVLPPAIALAVSRELAEAAIECMAVTRR